MSESNANAKPTPTPCPACNHPDCLTKPEYLNTCPECGYDWPRGPVLEIIDDGTTYHPAEYAGLWGDGASVDGCRFYNCSESVGQGCVIANPDWTPEDWREFAEIIDRQAEEVRRRVAEGSADGWSLWDAGNLARLAQWARARIAGPQRFTHFDGESGREIVRVTEAVAYGCSGSGAQDANVADAMAKGAPDVEWLADAAEIRAHLKRYGTWDAEELADDESNRERALWMACCDISEEPDIYAD